MRWCWKPIVLVFLASGLSAYGGDHFRIKARLLRGGPAGVNYRHGDVVSRGTYLVRLEREDVVEELSTIRRIQNPPLTEPKAAKRQTFRKVFRAAIRDVTTTDIRWIDATPVRLDDIRLAAYSDGRVDFTGQLQDLPQVDGAGSLVKERTDGCRVTVRVRGYGSTELESMAVNPNGPMLFESSQCFWMSKGDNYAISLVCPEGARISRSAYQELTHVQVEVETRRNR